MENNYLTIQEIYNWYVKNVNNTDITIGLFTYFVTNGFLRKNIDGKYPISKINSILLKNNNGVYKKNNDGKYLVKEERNALINHFKVLERKNNNSNEEFRLSVVNGNKLKLVRLK